MGVGGCCPLCPRYLLVLFTLFATSKCFLHNVQQRIVTVFNKAVKFGKLKANPFYQLEKSDIFPKTKT